MSLYLQHYGEQGPRLVLVHGWGLHGGVWDEVAEALAAHYRVTVVDLPGHGRSPALATGFDLREVAAALADTVAEPAWWVGWSLGGMIATQLAHDHPAQCLGLSLVASNPRFVREADWPHAQPSAVLAQFAEALTQDYRATVQRFVAVQALTSPHAKEEMRRLRASIFAHGEPDPAALAGGLAILAGADLRETLRQLACPVQLIMGTHDTLAPAEAGRQLLATTPGLGLHVIAGAGHCPFMTHREQFIDLLERFITSDA